MKPLMRQSLYLEVPQLDKNGKQVLDKYSRPVTTSKQFKCRTRVHGEEKQTMQLHIEDARDEVDVMPDTPVYETAKIKYTTISGETKTGTIKAIAETTNLSASKIYFRTCIIDG